MSSDTHLSSADRAFLDRARMLARQGWGKVQPNPIVGCVLVKDGTVVSEGHHKEFGGPHAEIVALEAARSRAEGATAYVSLEPCDHTGKTPPCSSALVQAGVARVVYGAADPGSTSGGGGEALREAGLEVVGPVWDESTGRAENPGFFHTARHESPYVAVKLSLTLDGRLAAEPGQRTHITGVDADVQVHRLRTGFDALIVGSGTALIDDPRLTVRLTPPGRRPPRRIVLDSHARLPSTAAFLHDADDIPVHVFTRRDAREGEMERLEAAGAHVHPVGSDEDGLDLSEILGVCWELGIRSVLCEGGAELASSFLRQGHAHRLYLFVAPLAVGTHGVPALAEDAAQFGWDRMQPAFAPELHGRDTLIVLDREAD